MNPLSEFGKQRVRCDKIMAFRLARRKREDEITTKAYQTWFDKAGAMHTLALPSICQSSFPFLLLSLMNDC